MQPEYFDVVDTQDDGMDIPGDGLTDEPSSLYPPLTEDDLDKLISNELESSITGAAFGDDEEDTDNAVALRYYFLRPRGDERSGRSKVISSDVQDTIDGTLADIMPVFTGSYNVVYFPPAVPGDTEQANSETSYINYLFFEESNGYTVLYEAIKDALLLRNGLIKVAVETDYIINERPVGPINDMQVARIMMRLDQTKGVEGNIKREIIEYNEESPGVNYLTIRETVTKKMVRSVCIPRENFCINSDHDSNDLNKARFMAHRSTITRGELLAEGVPFNIVDELPCVTSTDSSSTAQARDRGDYRDYEAAQRQTELVNVDEVSMLVDMDGDGIPERRYIRRVEGYIISNTVTDYVPFISVAPFINPHRWEGISMFDKTRQTQDIKTSVWRNLLDNLYKVTNQRQKILRGQVDLDDLLVNAPGYPVRVKRMDAIAPLDTNPVVLQSAYQALEYADKVRTENSGSSLDARRAQSSVPRDTSYGVERVVSARESLVGMVAKTIAETGIRDLFRKYHRLSRENLTEDFNVFFQGKWINGNPSKWRDRTRVCVAPSLSIGDMMRKKAALGETIAFQKEAFATGHNGTLVSEQKMYSAFIEYGRVSGLENPEDLWINPQSMESQQAAKSKAEQAKQAAEMQQKQAEMMSQLQLQIEQLGNQTELMKQEMNLKFQREKLYEESANDLTKMSLEYNQDLPGDKVK